MGDVLDGSKNAVPHQVHLSDFYIAEHEVTKELWTEVRDWAVKNGYADLPEGKGETSKHPVYSVGWFDITKWCNARSEMDGLRPCYMLDGEIYRIGDASDRKLSDFRCDFRSDGYRLPTEAEWEKAARGGKDGLRFPWGDSINHWKANYKANFARFPYQEPITLDQQRDPDLDPGRSARYMDMYLNKTRVHDTSFTHHKAGNEEPYTLPVGSFEPNGYGLYDMAGNVSEWCWDLYQQDFYLTSPELNPTGPLWEVFGLYSNVSRGGGGRDWPNSCRVANRTSGGTVYTGFRVVRR